MGDFARRHWASYALSGLMLAGVAVLTAWVPRKVGAAADALVAGELAGAALAELIFILIALGLVIYLLRVGWRILLFGTAHRLGVELRKRLYHRLTLHGPAFYQQHRTGDLMALATNDIDAIEMAAGEAFLAGFDGTLTLVVVVAMMTLGIDWRLGLVALLPFPLMAVGFYIISRRVHAASRRSLDAFSRLNEHTQESMSGIRAMRALGLEKPVHDEFARRAGVAADTGFEALRWESAYEPVVGVSLTAAMVLALGFGGSLVVDEAITIGALTAFTMYLGQLIWPMFAMGWVLSLIERGRAAWDRLAPVLVAPPDIPDDGSVAQVPAGRLQFSTVSQAWPGQPGDALHEVSFELDTGRTLGVVGPTGAGKSTLVALLLRQIQTDRGRITWAGRPLRDYSLQALHAAVAWVPQEGFLFSSSVAENIALSRPEAGEDEIITAARLADVHDDIVALPDGYRTRVGERGVTLSGGQRQRVAIARALLSGAPLLVLDDALSAVDTATETRILGHLRQHRAQSQQPASFAQTTIIITHRLSAVVDADHIIVLRDGRVDESGTHAELLAGNGWYAAQWRYQQLAASLDES